MWKFLGVPAALILAGCADTPPSAPTATVAVIGVPPETHPDVRHRPGYATYWSGQDLWEACGADAATAPPPACRSYVVGVSDGHNASYARKGLSTAYCLHVNSMADDLPVVVRNYLKAHPERRDRPAASLVMQALAIGYPCQRED